MFQVIFLFVCVFTYIFELPDAAGRPEVPVARAVPHPDGRLSLGHLGTQLRHRVETDLLQGRVLKVLEQHRDTVFAVYYRGFFYKSLRLTGSDTGATLLTKSVTDFLWCREDQRGGTDVQQVQILVLNKQPQRKPTHPSYIHYKTHLT